MDYITTNEAAKQRNITERMVVYHCSAGRIVGAQKMGNTWLILKTLISSLTGEEIIKNNLKRIHS